MATDIGELTGATILDADGEAVLAIKGTDGVAKVVVPEDTVGALVDTAREAALVYDPDAEPPSDGEVLIGDG